MAVFVHSKDFLMSTQALLPVYRRVCFQWDRAHPCIKRLLFPGLFLFPMLDFILLLEKPTALPVDVAVLLFECLLLPPNPNLLSLPSLEMRLLFPPSLVGGLRSEEDLKAESRIASTSFGSVLEPFPRSAMIRMKFTLPNKLTPSDHFDFVETLFSGAISFLKFLDLNLLAEFL